MKKWFVFILLIITTAGTFVPCCGADDCCEEETTSSPVSQNQKGEGTCSPFFACANCPCFFVVTKQIYLIQPKTDKPVHHQSFISLNLSGFSSACWQPPRIC